MRILSVPVTSITSRRPRLDTDRQDRVALSRLSALLKTPCWKPLCSEPSHPTVTEATVENTAEHSCKPRRMHSKTTEMTPLVVVEL